MWASLQDEVRLSQAMDAFENSSNISQFPNLIRHFDASLARDVAKIFEPAIPFTLAGLIYGGLGSLAALLLAAVGIGLIRFMRLRLFFHKQQDDNQVPL